MKEQRLITKMLLGLSVSIAIMSACNGLYYGNEASNIANEQTKLTAEYDEFVEYYTNTDECRKFYITQKQKLLNQLSNDQITGVEYDKLLKQLEQNIVLNSLNNSDNARDLHQYQTIVNQYNATEKNKNQASMASLISTFIAGIGAFVPMVEKTAKSCEPQDEEYTEQTSHI